MNARGVGAGLFLEAQVPTEVEAGTRAEALYAALAPQIGIP